MILIIIKLYYNEIIVLQISFIRVIRAIEYIWEKDPYSTTLIESLSEFKTKLVTIKPKSRRRDYIDLTLENFKLKHIDI
jgi:hypothetical protein